MMSTPHLGLLVSFAVYLLQTPDPDIVLEYLKTQWEPPELLFEDPFYPGEFIESYSTPFGKVLLRILYDYDHARGKLLSATLVPYAGVAYKRVFSALRQEFEIQSLSTEYQTADGLPATAEPLPLPDGKGTVLVGWKRTQLNFRFYGEQLLAITMRDVRTRPRI